MPIVSEDVSFFSWVTLYTCTGFLVLVPSLESSVSLLPAFLAMTFSYFLLGALLLLYLEANPQYYIINMKWSRFDLYDHILSSSRDLFVVLPCFLHLYFHYIGEGHGIVLTDPEAIAAFYVSPLSWVLIPTSVVVGLLWRMSVHRIVHVPLLYKWIHKKHHCPPASMTPFSSFNDTVMEFILMEVVGTFLMPVVINPLPLPLLCLLWSYQCFSGILDHCNAVVPGFSWIDAEYHFIHHQVTLFNFAEMELLDKIFGTLYHGPRPWRERGVEVSRSEIDIAIEREEREKKKALHDAVWAWGQRVSKVQ